MKQSKAREGRGGLARGEQRAKINESPHEGWNKVGKAMMEYKVGEGKSSKTLDKNIRTARHERKVVLEMVVNTYVCVDIKHPIREVGLSRYYTSN